MGRVGKLRYQSFVTATVRERSQRTDGLVPLRSLFWDRSVPTYKRATPYHFLRRPLSQKWRCSCVQAMVRQRYPDSIKITKRHPYGVQKKKKHRHFLVFQKATFCITFCITYVRFYGNFLLSEWRLIGNIFRLSKCQRIDIVYRLPIRQYNVVELLQSERCHFKGTNWTNASHPPRGV